MNSISYATNEIETLSFLSNDKSLNHITNLLIECEEQNAEKDEKIEALEKSLAEQQRLYADASAALIKIVDIISENGFSRANEILETNMIKADMFNDDFSYSRNKQIDKIFALVRSSLLTS